MNRSLRLRYVALAGAVFAVVGCSAHAGSFSPEASATYHAEAKAPTSGELLYAADNAGSKVLVFSYPEGNLVQTLTGFAQPPMFICSDASGNVFVPTTDLSSAGYIYEFAHGGSQPIETLADPGPGYAQSCSVDPLTHNLAVANGPDVAIYPKGKGLPKIYEASDVGAEDCAYDLSGDLFVDSRSHNNAIAELLSGGTDFSDITLTEEIPTAHLQWQRKGLVIGGARVSQRGPTEIFRVSISGSKGIVNGPILLYGNSRNRPSTDVEFALSMRTIAMPDGPGDSLINLWHYPRGGKPYRVINKRTHNAGFYGVALSE